MTAKRLDYALAANFNRSFFCTPLMYQALLTRRYLTSKVMPLLASLAVMLCTTMVLVTWSVMGGFLKVLLESGRKLVGDVRIEWSNTGFAHYDELIKLLESDTGYILAAAPVIESFGVLGLPDGRTVNVALKGIDPASFNRVTNYYDSLWWKPITTPLPKDVDREDPRLPPLKVENGSTELQNHDELWSRMFDNGKQLRRFSEEGGGYKPAIVMGTEVSGYNIREKSGVYNFGATRSRQSDGSMVLNRVILPQNGNVTLHVLPLDSKGRGVEMQSRIFPVANEFKTDVYIFDKNLVLVPIDELQKMLKMDKAQRLENKAGAIKIVKDPKTGEERIERPTQSSLVEEPARVTGILVRAQEGKTANQLADQCRAAYATFAKKHIGKVPDVDRISIQTWEQQNAQFIGAVKHEIGLVLFLFSIISLVAVVLVLSIFWSMVSEKTKDIGILRAMGASRTGIAWLWLRYGLSIGLVGSTLGFGLSFLIISNINAIHEWMGQSFGVQIWDPSVYYFSQIPSDLRWDKVIIVLSGGIIFSVMGALIPAIRAARMDPVQSLRFE